MDINEKLLIELNTFEHGSDEYIDKREEIFLANLNLARKVSRSFANTSRLEYDDIFVEAELGLLRAIEKFDINENIEFSTFATNCIKNKILSYIKNSNKHKGVLSLDQEYVNEDKNTKLEDLFASPNNFENDICNREVFRQRLNSVKSAMSKLTPSQNKCLRLRYFSGTPMRTLQEVAEILHCSTSFASELENKAILKLKNLLCVKRLTLNEIEKRQLKEKFKTFISSVLTTYQAQVLTMTYYEGLTQREIGQKLNKTVSNIGNIKTLAIDNLHKRYNAHSNTNLTTADVKEILKSHNSEAN